MRRAEPPKAIPPLATGYPWMAESLSGVPLYDKPKTKKTGAEAPVFVLQATAVDQ